MRIEVEEDLLVSVRAHAHWREPHDARQYLPGPFVVLDKAMFLTLHVVTIAMMKIPGKSSPTRALSRSARSCRGCDNFRFNKKKPRSWRGFSR